MSQPIQYTVCIYTMELFENWFYSNNNIFFLGSVGFEQRIKDEFVNNYLK